MIKAIGFQNYRVLRSATLPLGPFTLIVGPNGSGKSTAMEAFKFFTNESALVHHRVLSAGLPDSAVVEISMTWVEEGREFLSRASLNALSSFVTLEQPSEDFDFGRFRDFVRSFRRFSFNAERIAESVSTAPNPFVEDDGYNLAAVLDALRDTHPERFEDLNRELNRWMPEFDRILFEIPAKGKKRFLVRTSVGHHAYPAFDLSHGVRFAIAFLALAYLPIPPAIICFEEPDRGIHPRLLRDIQDAMYRLAFPQYYGETRPPVQVIATTHSPYLLDLYKENPEQVVISYKDETGGHFERLTDKPHLNEILEGAPLGEIWYSGILGGVPSTP